MSYEQELSEKRRGAIEEFTRKNIEGIVRMERERQGMQPLVSRIASAIAGVCSSGTTLVVHAAFFSCWIFLNTTSFAFDPFPFTFLTLVVSLEAIFLSFFIMVGQKISSQENERRHHLDLQINLLNEREMTAMLRLLGKIADRLEISEHDQLEIKKFAHNTDPRAVLEQIVTAEGVATAKS
jgi:uncharacterized membrane protein